VFHIAPQPPKYGSGVPKLSHAHRLEADGCQQQSGQRMRLNSLRRAVSGRTFGMKTEAGPFFNSSSTTALHEKV
jgi:hypothetical protein